MKKENYGFEHRKVKKNKSTFKTGAVVMSLIGWIHMISI
jgi:hypothetical protein